MSIPASHLLQMRGLKQEKKGSYRESLPVASFTDAWIETCLFVKVYSYILSHLLQMRGLKQKGTKEI